MRFDISRVEVTVAQATHLGQVYLSLLKRVCQRQPSKKTEVILPRFDISRVEDSSASYQLGQVHSSSLKRVCQRQPSKKDEVILPRFEISRVEDSSAIYTLG